MLGGVYLLVAVALRNDGGTEASAEIVGQFIKMGVTIDFNGFLSRVANHVAVVAPREMSFELRLRLVVHDAIKIVSKLLQKVRTFHELPSPLVGFAFPFPLSRF